MDIAFGFDASQWEPLRARAEGGDPDAWTEAIGHFRARMNQRYMNPIAALEKADSRPDGRKAPPVIPDEETVPGFAIVMLAASVLETLYNFREGEKAAAPLERCGFGKGDNRRCVKDAMDRPEHSPTKAFTSVLGSAAFGREFPEELAVAFAKGLRNALAHETETREWLIWRELPEGKIVGESRGQHVLNRTRFIQALRQCLDDYARELGDPSNAQLRANFLRQMTKISKTDQPPTPPIQLAQGPTPAPQGRIQS